MIIYQYSDNVVQAAEHDLIMSEDIDVLIDGGITEDEVRKLNVFGWFLDPEFDCLCHHV